MGGSLGHGIVHRVAPFDFLKISFGCGINILKLEPSERKDAHMPQLESKCLDFFFSFFVSVVEGLCSSQRLRCRLQPGLHCSSYFAARHTLDRLLRVSPGTRRAHLMPRRTPTRPADGDWRLHITRVSRPANGSRRLRTCQWHYDSRVFSFGMKRYRVGYWRFFDGLGGGGGGREDRGSEGGASRAFG